MNVTGDDRPRELPLSVAQEDPWYVSRLGLDTAVYHEAVILHRYGGLDVAAFQRAFAELVNRHEAWRTTFPDVGGLAVQRIAPVGTAEVACVDLSDEPPGSVEEAAAELATETICRPYDLEREAPLRPLLVKLAADRYRLYLALHHLLFDGLALTRVAIPELVQLYDGFATGASSELAPVPAQYADYTMWERAWLDGAATPRRLAYWRHHLDGISGLDLPLDRPRNLKLRLRGAAVPLMLDRDAVARIRHVASAAHGSLFQVMAAGFAALLHTYTGHDDVAFGTVTDLRRRPDLEAVLGYCATPLPLRLDLSGDPTFTDLLGRIRNETLDAYDHAVPFNWLIRELHPSRDVGLNPFMQALLVQEPSADLPSGWDLELANARLANDVGAATLDLQIEFEERPGGTVSGRAIFDADLFDSATVRLLVDRWLSLLDSAAENPDRPISELSAQSWPEPPVLVPDRTTTETSKSTPALVHVVVADTARRRPDASAVICDGRTLTYGALMAAALTVVERLRVVGVGVGDVVGVVAERSVDTVAAILAILCVGAAYLPLDPSDPPKRIAFMLTDAQATAIVTGGDAESLFTDDLPDGPLPKVSLDEIPEPADRSHSYETAMAPTESAYVIYTSGSTGQPKGVRVPHHAVTNLMSAMSDRPGITADDVLLSVAAFTFDASVGDLFATLGAGGTIVLATRDEARDPAALARLLDSSQATVMQATPTTWQMLVDSGWRGTERLVAWTGGEATSDDLAGELRNRTRALWNLYGPTEATVWATAGQLTPRSPVTVGTALANMRVYVVGRSARPAPVGVVGEVCIAGRGVADGYVNRDAETAERFVADPLVAGERMYRTGDRGRLLSSGQLQILGRADDQLKVRGVRIEPGEIEAALRGHPSVSAAVVVVREYGPSDQRLVAYVVGSDSVPLAAPDLIAWLRTTLPGRLMPSVVMPIEALPVNANGKVDRRALPIPPMERPSDVASAPTDPLERDLARLWAETLGVTQVGRHDDFFELGGHSLLAVQLLVQVEQLVDRRIPVSWLGDAGNSVAGLAQLIRDGGDSATGQPDRDVEPVSVGGDHAPNRLILIWPNAATAMAVRHLRTKFGADEPISSIVPEYSSAASLSLADLADRAYDQIRDIQPSGPYALGGYSLGGALAYEIAGRLQAGGETVDFLVVFDAPTPKLAHHSGELSARVRRFLRNDARERRMQIRRMVNRLPRPWHGRWRVEPVVAPSPEWPELVAALEIRALGERVAGYISRGHALPLHLFASDATVSYFHDATLGWKETHLGRLLVHRVPGDHASIWTVPLVEQLASQLVEQFRSATSRTPATS